CQACDAVLAPADARFCSVCGMRQPPAPAPEPARRFFCDQCGRPLRDGARFCSTCGTSTPAPQLATVDRRRAARRELMNKSMQVYYAAVLGALGGLLGWWIMGSVSTGSWNVWLACPLVGAGLGLCIGGCVAATDGALIKRSARRALRDGLLGGV